MTMKTFIKTSKLFLALAFVLGFQKAQAQGCIPGFTYVVNPNGVVNFMSTSTGVNSLTTQYYWTFTGGSPSTFTGTGGAGMAASTTYTASGIYTVNLFIMTVPSCSNAISQTVAINLVPSPTCAISVSTTAATNSATCNGSATVTNVSGLCGAPSYTWIPGGMTGGSVAGLCPGTVYTVIASGGSGTNCCASVSQTLAVSSTTCQLNAGFTYTQGLNGLVNFVNTSTGINTVSTTYAWNFGNGQISNAFSPSHTYTANGTYTVTLLVQNGGPACASSFSAILNINNVTGNPCNLNASFVYTQTANGSVQFVNTSSGLVNPTYQWNFGNGQQSSSASPLHTYTANGLYLVMLIVTNSGTPSCIDTAMASLNITNVSGPCNLSAGFSHTVGANGVVNFASTSTGTVANSVYFWNYGDGTTGFGANPNHTYPSSGVYFVLMTAINNSVNCTSTASMAINVSGINCVANSNFSIAPTNTPQYWTATPSFPWNVSNALWSWGDGSSSNGLYVSHTYSAAGLYSICLTVTVNCGSSSSTCATYSISKINAGQAMIQINVVAPELVEVGLDETGLVAEDVTLYPNPGNGLLSVESARLSGELHLRILDLQGKELYVQDLIRQSQKAYTLDLQHLPSGIYLMELQQGNHLLYKKLIITKD